MRQTALLAGNRIAVHVWVENPTDGPISDLRLRLAAPSFIKLGEPVGDEICRIASAAIPLVTVPAHSALDPQREFCLQADQWVEEQDVNVAFSLAYLRSNANPPERGVAVVEKKLSIGLFGTDTVAGVSLRLATYFLPGMLLFLLLRVGRLRGLDRLTAVDVAVLSVLFSVGLVWLGSYFFGTKGVSALIFLILCGIAAALGLAAIAVQQTAVFFRSLLLIDVADSTLDALKKALRQNAVKSALCFGRPQPTAALVIARGGALYAGALAARTNEGGTALLGWFELETKNPQLLACMQRLHGKRKLLQLIKLGEKSEVTPTVRNAVQQRSAAGVWESTGAELKRIPKEEVAQVSRGPIDGLVINDRPISVAG